MVTEREWPRGVSPPAPGDLPGDILEERHRGVEHRHDQMVVPATLEEQQRIHAARIIFGLGVAVGVVGALVVRWTCQSRRAHVR